MSDEGLPHGWRSARIEDVVTSVPNIDPTGIAQSKFNYIDIGSIDSSKGTVAAPKRLLTSQAPSRARQSVRKGDVLFSTVRPYLGAIAMTPALEDVVASTGFCVLRSAPEIDPRYLFYWVRSEAFINEVLPLQRGSSYPAVREQDVLERCIGVPPAAEQLRIADALDALFSALDEAEDELVAASRKLAQYRQSLLKAAVEGDLTAEWRKQNPPQETGAELLERILYERRKQWEAQRVDRFIRQERDAPKDWQSGYREPAEPQQESATPLGWTWATVDQLTPDDLSNGRSVPTSDRGAKVLRLTAVRRGVIDLGEFKLGAWTELEAAPFCVHKGDLLIVRGNGSLSLVGRAGIVPAVTEPVAFPDTLIRLRTLDSVIRPAWLAALWNAARTRDHLESRARTSAGIYKISQPDIVSVTVPVPPLKEQDAVLTVLVAEYAQLDQLQASLDRGMKMARAQRQNILRAAFSGQLVPQDPADEPASVLLDRIRGDREANAGAAAPRRGRKPSPARPAA